MSGLARRLRSCCCPHALATRFSDLRATESGELTQALVGDKPAGASTNASDNVRGHCGAFSGDQGDDGVAGGGDCDGVIEGLEGSTNIKENIAAMEERLRPAPSLVRFSFSCVCASVSVCVCVCKHAYFFKYINVLLVFFPNGVFRPIKKSLFCLLIPVHSLA